MTLLTWPSRE